MAAEHDLPRCPTVPLGGYGIGGGVARCAVLGWSRDARVPRAELESQRPGAGSMMSSLVEQSDDVGSNPLSWLYGKTEACEHEPSRDLEVGMLLAHELVHGYYSVAGSHDG